MGPFHKLAAAIAGAGILVAVIGTAAPSKALAATMQSSTQLRVQPMVAPSPTLVQGGISPGSVYENQLEAASATTRASVMTAMYNAGARWIRIDTPNTTRNHDLIHAARAAGLNVDILVQDWTTSDTPAAIGSVASTIAQHYSAEGNHTFEILNEPNMYLTAANYTALLQAAYTNIHAADSSATVISGGMAPDGGIKEPYTYLSDMYTAGASGYMDAVGDHPYAYPNTPNTNDPTYNPWQYLPMGWPTSSCANIGASACLSSIMAAHGDGSKKIWITEFGAPTGTDNGYPAYSQEFQAASITQAFSNANSVSYAGPVFNYQWQDDTEGDFGLLDSSGTAKQGLAAFTNGVAGRATPPPQLTAGQSLASNQTMTNPTTAWVLMMQSDGNLVLDNAVGATRWASNTYGNPGAHALMQSDGNFVIYDTNWNALWATNTYGNPGSKFIFRNDNNLVIENTNGVTIWSSGT